METKKINWASDFKINESLHAISRELSAAYGRMCFNNEGHVDEKLWKENSLKWADYDRSIKDLVFDSEESAQQEVDKLSAQCKETLALEKTLLNNSTA